MSNYHSFFVTAKQLEEQPENDFSQLYARAISYIDLPELRDFIAVLHTSDFEEKREEYLILLLKAFVRLDEPTPDSKECGGLSIRQC